MRDQLESLTKDQLYSLIEEVSLPIPPAKRTKGQLIDAILQEAENYRLGAEVENRVRAEVCRTKLRAGCPNVKPVETKALALGNRTVVREAGNVRKTTAGEKGTHCSFL